MEYILGIFIAMGGVIFTLLKANGNLRSKNKLKDLEVADTKLETEQAQIKREKQKLKKELGDPHKIKENLSDKEIEEFWGVRRKGDDK